VIHLHTLLADLRDVLPLRQAAAAELQRGEHRGAHIDTARGDQHVADGIDVVHAGPLQLVVQQLPVLGVERHALTLQRDLSLAGVAADGEDDCVELVLYLLDHDGDTLPDKVDAVLLHALREIWPPSASLNKTPCSHHLSVETAS